MTHALIFDIDGTLTQTNSVDNECFVEAVECVLKLPGIDTNWDSYSHVTDQCIIEEICIRQRGTAISSSELREVERYFVSLLQNRPRALFLELPGAAAFLKGLKASEIPVAIATGCWRASAEFKLQEAGIEYSEVPLATSSEALSREDIMMLAHDALLKRLNLESFDRVTYFGDATWDARASHRLGWDFIGIGAATGLLAELQVKHTFPDFDADDIVESLGIQIAD